MGNDKLLPPLPEQRKIAAILSTWDDSIATLTNLLTAKRQQKRGLAEALLTGKKRLPGFEGEWEEKKLGEVFYLLIGGTPSRKEATFWDVDRTTENVWLSIADLKEKYASDSKEYISDLGAKKSNVKRIPANTVVMSFKLTLGRAAITTRPLYTNEAICAFIPMQENVVDTEYFYQSIALMDFTDGVDIAVKGATMNKEKLTNFSFSLPPFREQKAIASILSTLDSEIASLEALKAKVQEQKRGLMDELLTGRVRVKVEG
ncbi:restriction endonuclease subunit S [Deinococcus sp. VB343]|uniref:restriction endonuclease subunit S n=1 Tax=Deinococcus sp. VB343 TaxID=3385567 RepID=UPI0039C94A32